MMIKSNYPPEKVRCIIDTAKEVLNDLLDKGTITPRQAYETICDLPYTNDIKGQIDGLIDDREEQRMKLERG